MINSNYVPICNRFQAISIQNIFSHKQSDKLFLNPDSDPDQHNSKACRPHHKEAA